MPIPAVANIPFLVTIVGVPIAAALMVRQPRAGLRTLLDGLLIGTSLLYVVWALVLGPRYRAGTPGLGTIGYALADVLIVSLTVLVLSNAHPTVRPALELAAVAMVTMFAADSTYAFLNIDGHYRFGGLPDLLWFGAFVVLATAAPQRRALRGLAELAERDGSRDFLPYVPFSLAFVTGVVAPLVQRRLDPALYGFSIALTLIVVTRQLITVTENRSLNRRLSAAVRDLRFRADHDSLTGLGNRALFEAALESARGEVAVLYIDLDGFKPINDTYGHERGDQALVTVAQRLHGTARAEDVVARLGGDEFAILTAGVSDPALLATRVLAALREPLDLDGHAATVGASIGIARGDRSVVTPGSLLRNADTAMYAAKRQGRNRFVEFDPQWLDTPAGL